MRKWSQTHRALARLRLLPVLPVISVAKLERTGGYFGWVLRLVQQRRSRVEEFQQLEVKIVAFSRAMASRRRWTRAASALRKRDRLPTG